MVSCRQWKVLLGTFYVVFCLFIDGLSHDGNLFPFASWNLYSSIRLPSPFSDIMIEMEDGNVYWLSESAPAFVDRNKLWNLTQQIGKKLIQKNCNQPPDESLLTLFMNDFSSRIAQIRKIELYRNDDNFVVYIFDRPANPTRTLCQNIYEKPK